MKLLNVEMYTVIKGVKSEHVTVDVADVLNMTLSLFVLFFPRAVQGVSWPLSGAASVTWCLVGHQRFMWRKPKLLRPPRRDVRNKQNSPVEILLGVAVEWGWAITHSRRCEAKQNVALKMRNCVLLVKHDERSSALWVHGRRRRRRLKWGKWMWCIYRASAQWLFDLPASSLPLPTTILRDFPSGTIKEGEPCALDMCFFFLFSPISLFAMCVGFRCEARSP